MANINDLYPSKYIKAADIKPNRVDVQVARVVVEDIADGELKPVMYFNGRDKGLVVNKTNALMCAHVWGDDTDAWVNQWLTLHVEPVQYQGRIVDGLRVLPKMPQAQPPGTPAQQQPQQPPQGWPQTSAPQQPPSQPQPSGPADDDIPF